MVSPNPQVAHSVWHSIMDGYLRYFNGRFGVVVVPRREEKKSVRNNPNELRLDEESPPLVPGTIEREGI